MRVLTIAIVLSLPLLTAVRAEEAKTPPPTAQPAQPAAKPAAVPEKPPAEPAAAEPASKPAAAPVSQPAPEPKQEAAPASAPEKKDAAPAQTPEQDEAAPKTDAAEPATKASESLEPVRPAAEPPPRIGLVVAPKLGATFPTSKLGTAFFGAIEVGYDFTFLAGKLGPVVPGVAIEFSYLQPTLSGAATSTVAGDYSYKLSQRIMILALDAVATLDLKVFQPYAALGYGFTFLHASIDSFGMTNTEDQLRSGLQARAGLTYELWRGGVFIEIKYHWVGLEFLSTGEASGGGLTSNVGYRFKF